MSLTLGTTRSTPKTRAAPSLAPYVFVAPAVLILAVLLTYPWAWTLYLSTWWWSPLSFDPARFVGLANYARLVADEAFWQAALLSLRVTAGAVTGTILMGFALALILFRLPRGCDLCLAVLILPMMIAPSVVGIMWRTLLHEQWGGGQLPAAHGGPSAPALDKDLADGVFRALTVRPLRHRLFDITGGRLYTRCELAEAIRAAVPGASIELGPGLLPHKHLRGACDLRRAQAELGYAPAYDLTRGVAEYAAWLRQYSA